MYLEITRDPPLRTARRYCQERQVCVQQTVMDQDQVERNPEEHRDTKARDSTAEDDHPACAEKHTVLHLHIQAISQDNQGQHLFVQNQEALRERSAPQA